MGWRVRATTVAIEERKVEKTRVLWCCKKRRKSEYDIWGGNTRIRNKAIITFCYAPLRAGKQDGGACVTKATRGMNDRFGMLDLVLLFRPWRLKPSECKILCRSLTSALDILHRDISYLFILFHIQTIPTIPAPDYVPSRLFPARPLLPSVFLSTQFTSPPTAP